MEQMATIIINIPLVFRAYSLQNNFIKDIILKTSHLTLTYSWFFYFPPNSILYRWNQIVYDLIKIWSTSKSTIFSSLSKSSTCGGISEDNINQFVQVELAFEALPTLLEILSELGCLQWDCYSRHRIHSSRTLSFLSSTIRSVMWTMNISWILFFQIRREGELVFYFPQWKCSIYEVRAKTPLSLR